MSVELRSVADGYRPPKFELALQEPQRHPTLITDEWLGLIDLGEAVPTVAQYATAETVARKVITLHVNSWEEFHRLRPVIERCISLLELKAGWDSYGARAPKISLFEAGLQLITRLVGEGAPTPHVVPTNRGGLQFEWALAGRELEIEVLGTNRFDVVYEDDEADDSFEGEVLGDLGPVLEQVAKLSAAR